MYLRKRNAIREILLAGFLSLLPINISESNSSMSYPLSDVGLSRAALITTNSSEIEAAESEKKKGSLLEKLEEGLDEIEYKDKKTESRFRASMANYRTYGLEDDINKASDKFKIDRKYGIALMIVESNLNPNAGSNNGCVGLGQTNRAAVKEVNKNFGTSFKYAKKAPIEDQVGAAFGFYSMKLKSIMNGYGVEEEDASKMAWFAYNAGGAPLHLALKRLSKKEKPLTWENVEALISPELLRSSSSYYRRLSNSKLRQKVQIIRAYVRDASDYFDYLESLEKEA